MKTTSAVRKKSEPDTVERLLDASERLFGEHGYDGVGLRMLTKAARVDLGAATYHFGSKDGLFLETFMRRYRPVHDERVRRLQEASVAKGGDPVEKIIECLLRPSFEAGQGDAVSQRFLARALLMPTPAFSKAIRKQHELEMEAFISAMHKALPQMSEDLLRLRYTFAVGSLLIYSLYVDSRPELQDPKVRELVLLEMIRFITAGVMSEPGCPVALPPSMR